MDLELFYDVNSLNSRPRQAKAIQAIHNFLKRTDDNNYKFLLFEGETGLGKTLAYLLAAVEDAEQERQRQIIRIGQETFEQDDNISPGGRGSNSRPLAPLVIVATATRALQQQLLDSDLPRIRRYMEEQNKNLNVINVRGRQNFICQKSVETMTDVVQQELFELPEDESSYAALIRIAQELRESNAQTIEDAMQELRRKNPRREEAKLRDMLKSFIPSGMHSCTGCNKRCQYHDMNRALMSLPSNFNNVNIIVTNHHALLYNHMLKNTIRLYYGHNPTAQHNSVSLIIDEAHKLPETIIDAATISFKPGSLKKLMTELQVFCNFYGGMTKQNFQSDKVFDKAQKLYAAAKDIVDAIEKLGGNSKNNNLFFLFDEKLSDDVKTLNRTFKQNLHQITSTDLEIITRDLSIPLLSFVRGLKQYHGDAGIDDAFIRQTKERIQGLCEHVLQYIITINKIYNYEVKWAGARHIERIVDAPFSALVYLEPKGDGIDIMPIDAKAGIRLNNMFFLMPNADAKTKVVCVSATLSIGKKFDYFRDIMGFPKNSTVHLYAPSDFPFDKHARLYIPKTRHLPHSARHDEWEKEVVDEIIRLVDATNGGALALFSNIDFMRKVYFSLGNTPGFNHPIYCQTIDSAHEIRKALHDGNGLVMGVHSLWQGIDIKGHALRNLIIVKLPFDTPDSPFVKGLWQQFLNKMHVDYDALPEKEKRRIEKTFFYKVHLPQTIFMFKQGFGRAIRSSQDKAIISVLDNRVMMRKYGKDFLKSLPDVPLVRKFDEVQQFVQQTGLDLSMAQIFRSSMELQNAA